MDVVKKVSSQDYRVLCPNLLGYGGSDRRQNLQEPNHWENPAVVAELLEKEACPLVLVGHSTGGNVALEIALRTDLPISQLILFEPGIPALLRDVGDDAMWRWCVSEFIEGAVAMIRRGDPSAMQIMADAWSGDGAFQNLPEKVKTHLQSVADTAVYDIEASFANTYDLEQLTETRTPTLVITGDAGRQLGAKIATHLVASLPDCRHQLINGADHNLIVTHAERCTELLLGFMQSI